MNPHLLPLLILSATIALAQAAAFAQNAALAQAPATLPAPPPADPQAVAEVKAGKRTQANAAWWGFAAEDATDCLQAAIDSGAAKLVVPNLGRPWVVRPIRLRGDMEIVFEKGCEVVAKPGGFPGKGDCLFSARSVSNLSLVGPGATWRMQKPEYTQGEWRHTLGLFSCSSVKVVGLALKDSGGDGIYVGHDGRPGAKAWCQDVTIQHVTCDNHRRQGLSVITAVNLTIEDSAFLNTQGTAPQAGIDFEPNRPDERLVCTVRRCRFENNRGCGILLYAAHLNKTSQDIRIQVSDCRISGSGQAAITLSNIKDDGPGGLVQFERCTTEFYPHAGGLAIANKSADRARIAFADCTWKLAPLPAKPGKPAADRPAVVFGAPAKTIVAVNGGVRFDRCRVEDSRPVAAVRLSGAQDAAWKDISGVIVVVGTEPKLDAGQARIELEVRK